MENILIIGLVIFILINLIYIGAFIKPIFLGNSVGYVNITIHSLVAINLTRDIINWGDGMITGTGNDRFNATLYTSGDNVGIVLRGNWSGQNASAFIIENIGSVNCSIYVKTNKDAHDFFLSETNSNEEYRLKISNRESGSCDSSVNNVWVNANKTGKGTLYCNSLDYNSSKNEVFLDVYLTVPHDSLLSGVQSDMIVITGEAV